MPGSLLRTFNPNGINRLQPEGQTSTFDPNGNITSTTDPKGQVIENDYDPGNRVVETRLRKADGSVEETRHYTLDKVGNPLTVQDASGTTTYSYDRLYRVRRERKSSTGERAYSVLATIDDRFL